MQLPSAIDMMWFLEVSRTLNFTRAAERLGITQPALTQCMKRLESVLQTELCKRERTGVALTKAGERLRDRAEEFLGSWQDLAQSVGRLDDDVAGTYRIGLHSSLVLHIADKMIAGLMRDFRHLNLVLDHQISRKIVEGVISQKIDFGIVVNPIEQDDLVIKELSKDRFTFWGTRETAENPAEQTFIFHPELKQCGLLIGSLPFKPKQFIESTSLEAIAHLVSRGVGIGILPERLIRHSCPGDDLVSFEDWGLIPERICLIYRQDRHLNPASKAIIRAMRAAC